MKLFCPVTQFPRYGSCQSRYSDTYFLMIGITFRMHTNFSRLRYGARDGKDYNDIGLGVAIRRQVYHALGLNQCGRCVGKFYQSNLNEKVGNSKLTLYYDFQAAILTHGSRCSDEVIVAAMSKIIGEELIVYLEEDEYITLDIGEVENISDFEWEMNASLLRLPAAIDDTYCLKEAYLSFRDLNKCPMVNLDDTYYPSLMHLADTAAKTRLVKTLFAMNGGREELSARINITSVCWKDYRTLVTSLSLKHTGNTFCSILISFVIILLD